MSDCLQRNALPDVLQEAALRLPRKSSRTAKAGTGVAKRGRFPTIHNDANNYLAEAAAMHGEGPTSPLGGRNRKGAGAPVANRNARGGRSLRLHIHLKKRLLAERLQLLVLSAAVSHLERCLVPRSPARTLHRRDKNSRNNYLAEDCVLRGSYIVSRSSPQHGAEQLSMTRYLVMHIPSRHAEVLATQFSDGHRRCWGGEPRSTHRPLETAPCDPHFSMVL